MTVSTDVVVVGGGVIGLAVAWRAARAGLAVTVVDPGSGDSASWVAAGMLAPVSESSFGEESLLRLNLLAVDRFPSFVAELEAAAGQSVGLRREGTLTVAYDAGDRAVLARMAAWRRTIGLAADELDARACRAREPLLSADIHAGVFSAADWSVDNRGFVAALRRAGARDGVHTVTDRVAEVAGSGRGVTLVGGDVLTAGTVVLAAGAWSGAISGVPAAVRAAVRPVKGQLLRLRLPDRLPPVLRHTVRGTIRGADIYLVPRADGEIVVGATMEERGFDRTVTCLAAHDLLRNAMALLPVLGELVLAETCVGLRPGTTDNGPLVGTTDVEGLLVATGHFRNGVLLAPLTADAIVAALTGAPVAEQWAPFTAARVTAGMCR